jgi:hypothetical protein
MRGGVCSFSTNVENMWKSTVYVTTDTTMNSSSDVFRKKFRLRPFGIG